MAGGIKPTVTVDWSPTTGPLDTPTWVNITGWRSINISRGRRSEVDQMQAGTATIVLDNRTRRFDPLYTAGANYPNVVPMKRVRVRAVYNSVTYDLFQGFIDSWNQGYVNPRDATVELRCTDLFGLLNAAIFSPSPYEVEVRADSPRAWFRLGEPAGPATVTDVISGVTGTASDGVTFGTAGLVAQDSDSAAQFPTETYDSIQVGTAAFPTSFPFTVEFWHTLGANPAGSSEHDLFAVRDPADDFVIFFLWNTATAGQIRTGFGAGNVQSGVSGIEIGDTIHVAVTATSSDVKLYINGSLVDTDTHSAAAPTVEAVWIGNDGRGENPYSATGVLDDVAIYPTELSAGRIADHYEAGTTPWAGDTTGERISRALDYLSIAGADRDIDTTTTILQQASLNQTVLAHMQDVNEVEQGLLFITADGDVRFRGRVGGFNQTSQATFGDAAGELPYTDIGFEYSNQTIFNVVRRQNQDGLLMEASNAASIAAYGRRVDTKTGLLGSSDLDAFDLANFRLSRVKDPVMRVSEMALSPERAPTTLYPQVLGRELGEQITLKRRPQAVGTVMSFDARIEGVTHSISPEAWSAVFRLSPADSGSADSGTFWQLNATAGPGLDAAKLAY